MKLPRLQFSLRTLLIAVLLYATLGVLTIYFAPAALAQHYTEMYYRELVEEPAIYIQSFSPDGKLISTRDLSNPSTRLTTKSTVYAPFLLSCSCTLDGSVREEGTFLWLFGRIYPLRERKHAIFYEDSSWVPAE